MASNLLEVFQAWTTSSELTYRVYGGMIEESLLVKNEPTETPNHAARLTLANRVLGKPLTVDQQVMAHSYARALQEPGILEKGNDATDAEIRAAVDAIFDDVAGAG
jgi:hypothetical protein